jgi:hypothetical protein
MGGVRSKYAGKEGCKRDNCVEFNSQTHNILQKIITLLREAARLPTTQAWEFPEPRTHH